MAPPRLSPYHRLSIAAKERRYQSRMREPAVWCSVCETQLVVTDLPRHADSCPGRRAPHPLSRWVGWREALELGVPPGTLHRWVTRGLVRWRGSPPRRQYLLRDVSRRWLERRVGRGEP